MKTNNKHITLSIFIFIMQVLVFNEVNIGGYINPYIYPLIILLIPFDIAGWLLLIVAFALGLTIDLFTGTIGMHALAAVIMAASKPSLVKLLSLSKFENGNFLSIKTHGFVTVLLFVGVLIFIHHLFYFTAESWNYSGFGHTILRIILSSIISVTFSTIILLVFNSTSKR